MRNLNLDAAVADVEARYVAAHAKSKARFEAAGHDMPGGNTRTVLHYDPFPVTLTRGDGARLTDLDGHTYIDFLGEFTAGLYGHSEPAVLSAIKEALADGLVLGGPNRFEARLARLMCERFPALELVRFCNSGSEATLMCVSLARATVRLLELGPRALAEPVVPVDRQDARLLRHDLDLGPGIAEGDEAIKILPCVEPAQIPVVAVLEGAIAAVDVPRLQQRGDRLGCLALPDGRAERLARD